MIIILVAAVAVVLTLIVTQMIGSKGNSQGVNIHTDENSKIQVSTVGNQLQIQITYESTENRPSDAFLFPDPDPLPPPIGALDRAFWLKVASYDDLSREEKMEIDERLAQSGFFRRDETSVQDAMKGEEAEREFAEIVDNFADGEGVIVDDEPPAQPGFSPIFTYE